MFINPLANFPSTVSKFGYNMYLYFVEKNRHGRVVFQIFHLLRRHIAWLLGALQNHMPLIDESLLPKLKLIEVGRTVKLRRILFRSTFSSPS